MKIRQSCIIYVLIVLFVLLVTGCIQPSQKIQASQQIQQGQSTPDVLINRSIKLYDSDNTFFGYCIGAHHNWINCVSPKNYFYSLSWNGNIAFTTPIHYTEENFNGKPFIIGDKTVSMYGKTVFIGKNKIYTFANLNTYNNAIFDDTITAYKSMWILTTEFSSQSPTTLHEKQKGFLLREISREEAGIPLVIKLPLVLKYE